MEMARQLVSSLAAEFDPEKYHDEYREELLALIEKKAAGEEIVAPRAHRGAGEGARPHGRARSEPGAHRREGRERSRRPRELARHETGCRSAGREGEGGDEEARAGQEGVAKPSASKKAPAKRTRKSA